MSLITSSSNMDKDGLGTLAVLPREVRDMISSYVLFSLGAKLGCLRRSVPGPLSDPFSSVDYKPLTHWLEIVSADVMRVSGQLRQELLEAFLRDDGFVGYMLDSGNIERLLNHLRPSVDLATHVRAIGLVFRSPFVNIGDPPRYWNSDRPYIFLRRVKMLGHWHDAHRIPSHSLLLPVNYQGPDRPRPLYPYRGEYRLAYLSGSIKVHVASKEKSMAELDEQCMKMLRVIKQKFNENNQRVNEKVRLNVDNFDSANKRVSEMRGHHEKIINEVTKFWQEREEFEDYCLGDFFALAETW